MLTLLIETSTERGVVALSDGAALLFRKELPFGFNNSKFLMSVLEELFQQTGIRPEKIKLIAAGIGPGSYTGMRVGAATAKALSYALKIPLVGVCSLEGFVPTHSGTFAAMIDAKIGGAYLLTGIKKDEEVKYDSQPSVKPINAIGPYLKQADIVVTPYCEGLRKKVHDCFPDASCEWEERSPCAETMLNRAAENYAKGQFSTDGKLELLYLRKTQAELEKEEKKN